MCNTHQEPYKGIITFHQQLAVEKMSSTFTTEGVYLGLWATSSSRAVARSLRRPQRLCGQNSPWQCHDFGGSRRCVNVEIGDWTNISCKQARLKLWQFTFRDWRSIWSNLSWPGEVQLNPGDVLQDGEGKEKLWISQHYGPYTPEN